MVSSTIHRLMSSKSVPPYPTTSLISDPPSQVPAGVHSWGASGVGGQCEVLGGGDRGAALPTSAMPTSAMPTAGCKVGEGRCDPETLLRQ